MFLNIAEHSTSLPVTCLELPIVGARSSFCYTVSYLASLKDPSVGTLILCMWNYWAARWLMLFLHGKKVIGVRIFLLFLLTLEFPSSCERVEPRC